MDLQSMIQFLKNTDGRRVNFQRRYEISKRYYFNQNDITMKNNGRSEAKTTGKVSKDEPLRRADNRVSSNFHQIIVDQKADYVASIAPVIDVDSDDLNKRVKEILGDDFSSILYQLVVDASNSGIGWLHVWHDANNKLRFAVIPPDQVTPLYSGDTDKTLLAVRRTYAEIDQKTGKQFTAIEYWNKDTGTVYKTTRGDYEDLVQLKKFAVTDVASGETTGESATVEHGFGVVPFIPFYNNKFNRPDLDKYKGYIDIYDQVYNGFANDIADVQQVILVLTNYGGTDLDEFMDELRKHHAIKMDTTMPGDQSGVDKLTIDIPVEARKNVLDLTFDNIFTYGQAVNPNKLQLGNNTGVALKMMYANLELKANTVESWFRKGVAELIRIILNDLNVSDYENIPINQTWTRASIRNDVEQADVINKLSEVTSKETVAKNNPLVDDWQEELDNLQHDKDEEAKQPDLFVQPNPVLNTPPNDKRGEDNDDE